MNRLRSSVNRLRSAYSEEEYEFSPIIARRETFVRIEIVFLSSIYSECDPIIPNCDINRPVYNSELFPHLLQ